MTKNSLQFAGIFTGMVALALLLLTACGGGGGSAGGGIGGSGVIASGAVTAKGSIFVNGVEYETSTATVSLDGSPANEAALRRGMVVRVDGQLDTTTTGTAATVVYEDAVEGPVTDIVVSAQATTLTILGQRVIIEQDVTLVDNHAGGVTTTLPTFTLSDELEISGHRETLEAGAVVANGAIRATYIEVKQAPLSDYEVKGVVENANPPGSPTSFEIAGLTITTNGSTVGAIPADGTPVEVKGSIFSTSPDTLVATSIETRIAGLGETSVEHAEVEGFIDNIDTLAETFTLNGQSIDYSGATFEAGTIDDLADGVKVEAEGPINGGVLVADKIEFKESIRIEGDASDDDSDGSFAMSGLPGLTIFIDPALTEYDGLTNVSTGNHLRIRGREIPGTGRILATEIRLRSADSRIEFQAPATAFTASPGDNVTLMDTITVVTTDPFTFKDMNDATITRTLFYNNLTIGDLVKVRGDLAGPTADWQEIELEN